MSLPKPFTPYHKPIGGFCLDQITAIEKALESCDLENIEGAIYDALNFCDGLGLDDEHSLIDEALLEAIEAEKQIDFHREAFEYGPTKHRKEALKEIDKALENHAEVLEEAARETMRILGGHTP